MSAAPDHEPAGVASTRGARSPSPSPPKRGRLPVWAAVVMAGLAVPWVYFGAQRLAAARAPTPGYGVTTRSLPTSTRAPWIDGGFIEMVPPLRLPSRVDGAEKIEVWLKLPPSGSLGVRWIEGQKRHALTYPPGSVADRIETLDGVHIVDVRGTELGANGAETFHVYRGQGGGLLELTWPRDDAAAQTEATRVLVAHEIAEGRPKVQSLKTNNACGPCHGRAREERRSGVPARQTDAAGWFVPETVLRDRAPVEHHRQREMNVDDPFVRFECPSSSGETSAAKMITKDDGTRWPACEGKAVAIGVIDVASALAAGDEHAKAVCVSRRALHDRMDDEARRAFAPAFAVCAIR